MQVETTCALPRIEGSRRCLGTYHSWYEKTIGSCKDLEKWIEISFVSAFMRPSYALLPQTG